MLSQNRSIAWQSIASRTDHILIDQSLEGIPNDLFGDDFDLELGLFPSDHLLLDCIIVVPSREETSKERSAALAKQVVGCAVGLLVPFVFASW